MIPPARTSLSKMSSTQKKASRAWTTVPSMVFLFLLLIAPSKACHHIDPHSHSHFDPNVPGCPECILLPPSASCSKCLLRLAGEPLLGAPLVADLTDPARNHEHDDPHNPDNMKVFEQMVPGKFLTSVANIVPCGVALPHSHSNADALAYIIKSSPGLEGGYIGEDGNVANIENLKAGMTVTMPRGRVHWVTNHDCNEEVKVVQFFNNAEADLVRPDIDLASIPATVLSASLGPEVAKLLSKSPKLNPADVLVRSSACLARCAKAGRPNMWEYGHDN